MKIDTDDHEAMRLLGEHVEACRCEAILIDIVARRRPGAAWLLLPLGLGVEETLFRLMAMPVEHDAPHDFAEQNLQAIKLRRARAQAAWERYCTRGTETHVCH